MNFAKKFFFGLVVATTFTSPCLAQMDSSGSFYVSGHYSLEIPTASDPSASGKAPAGSASPLATGTDPRFVFTDELTKPYKPDYALGHTGGVQLGYYYPGGPRVEIEGFVSSIKPKADATPNNSKFSFVNTPIAIGTPRVDFSQDGYSNYSVMLNAYYDIISNDLPVAPYFGGGVGWTRLEFMSQKRNALGYQAKAGVSVSLGLKIRAYAGYRFLGFTTGDGFDITSSGTLVAGAPPTTAVVGYTIFDKSSYYSHGFEVGIIAAM